MNNPEIHVHLQRDPLDPGKWLGEFGNPSDGAVVSFIGKVRNKSRDKKVTHLEYEVYETMAIKELDQIAREACSLWPLHSCMIVHRFGRVEIGEASILTAVSSPHRGDAYEASRFIIDMVKKRVPIWKKEFYDDGDVWITEGS